MFPADGRPAPLHVVHDAAPGPADWEAVYREHVTEVYRFVYARVGNRADAEDVTSTTFMRALPHLTSTASTAERRGYLFTTARTALADLWRDRYAGGIVAATDDVPASEAVPGRTVDVEPVLAPLPARYRQVLELRFLRGYSVAETAAAMGISVSNAKVMQLRALRSAARAAEGQA